MDTTTPRAGAPSRRRARSLGRTFAALTLALATSSALVAPRAARAEYFPADRARSQPAPEIEVWDYQNVPFEHDRGFYLRLELAPAWFVSRARPNDVFDLGIEGGAIDAGASFGAIVAPNVALHGVARALVAPKPRVSLADRSWTDDGLGFALIGLAPAITGYGPSDVWGSVAFGAAIALYRVERDGVRTPESGYGPYFEMAAGKEWWVGPYSALGIFGRLAVHRVGTDYPEPFRGVSLSFGLSATFN